MGGVSNPAPDLYVSSYNCTCIKHGKGAYLLVFDTKDDNYSQYNFIVNSESIATMKPHLGWTLYWFNTLQPHHQVALPAPGFEWTLCLFMYYSTWHLKTLPLLIMFMTNRDRIPSLTDLLTLNWQIKLIDPAESASQDINKSNIIFTDNSIGRANHTLT